MNSAVNRPAAHKERRGRALDRKSLAIGCVIPGDSNAILRRTPLNAIHRDPLAGGLSLQTRELFRTDPSEHLRCTLTHFDHLHRIRIRSTQFSESNAAGFVLDGACRLIPVQKTASFANCIVIAKHLEVEFFSGWRNLTVASRYSRMIYVQNKVHAVLLC
jgi:hypothetical protein